MFTSIDVKRLRSRVLSTRRYAIEPGTRFAVGRGATIYYRDAGRIELTERDVVPDQAFTLCDLGRGTVVNDVTLVIRIVRKLSEERIETSADVIGRKCAEFIDLYRLRRCRHASRFGQLGRA